MTIEEKKKLTFFDVMTECRSHGDSCKGCKYINCGFEDSDGLMPNVKDWMNGFFKELWNVE